MGGMNHCLVCGMGCVTGVLYLWVMNEGATLAIWGLDASRSKLEALDDRLRMLAYVAYWQRRIRRTVLPEPLIPTISVRGA